MSQEESSDEGQMKKASYDPDLKINVLNAVRDHPHKFQIFTTIFNPIPFKRPPFEAERGFVDYIKLSDEERRKHFQTTMTKVKWSREIELERYQREYIRIRQKVLRDPELRTYWNYSAADEAMSSKCYRILAQRTMKFLESDQDRVKRKNQKATKPPKSYENYTTKLVHHPPENRILITKNLTWNKLDVLPVYSDIIGETIEDLKIPDSLLYHYNETNKVFSGTDEDLWKAIEMAERPENKIACTCVLKPDDSTCQCYDNENCHCFCANRKFLDLQYSTNRTDISTFKPILPFMPHDGYFQFAGFACSEDCACKGRCTNNVFHFLEKRIFQFELYRTNSVFGFGIRCSSMIPAGTPLMEFTGELRHEDNMKELDQDYAYKIVGPDEKEMWGIVEEYGYSPEYKELLRKISKSVYHIDPKDYGNIGRTAMHSCTPNMDMIRIYQKGVSPAHIRLVLVANENIFPGVPLTLDYGPRYVEDQLNNACACASFACMTGDDFDIYKKMDSLEMKSCFTEAGEKLYHKWWDEVVKPAKKIEEAEINRSSAQVRRESIENQNN